MQQRQSHQPQSETLTAVTAIRRARSRRAQLLAAGAGAILLALSATGCPEPADLLDAEKYKAPAVAMAEPCELDCVKAVFQQNTNGCKICHSIDPPLGDLDLRGSFTSRLRDVAAKHTGITPPATPGDCPTGDKLIDTANPNASWLLTKIRGMQKTCGTQMPTAPLGTSDMACVEAYISCVAGGKPLTGGGGAPAGGSGGAPAGGSGGGATTAGTGGAAAGSGGAPATAGSGGTGGA